MEGEKYFFFQVLYLLDRPGAVFINVRPEGGRLEHGLFYALLSGAPSTTRNFQLRLALERHFLWNSKTEQPGQSKHFSVQSGYLDWLMVEKKSVNNILLSEYYKI